MHIIPRERMFFDLFNQQAEKLNAAADLLVEMTTNAMSADGYAERFAELESEADTITHYIIDRLNRTFVTPIDREDIHALAHELDEIVDQIEATVARLQLYEMSGWTEEMLALCAVVSKSSQEIAKALRGLENMKRSKSILRACVEINRLENEGDKVLRRALQNLFRDSPDPLTLMKWKEIYEFLEEAIDRCEDVADIIEGVVIRNA